MSRAPGRARLAALCALAAALLATPGPAAAEDAPEDIGAAGAVLWEPATDAVLFDRDADVGRPMASTTKVMTSLLALEAGAYDDDVVVSAEADAIGRVPGGATLGLRQGQVVPMASLLAGLTLVSGNDAAVAVADHVAGDEEAFVERMNDRADELGLEDTSFVNSSGLTDHPDHRAAPMALARLGETAMRDERFAAIAGAAEMEVPVLGRIESRNELLGAYEGATGVKTGYTSLAGRTLIASAERGPRELYAVVLGSEDSFADAAALLDHGFEDFALVGRPADEALPPLVWVGGVTELRADGDLAATVPAGAELRAEVRLEPAVSRDAAEGEAVGELRLSVDGEVAETRPVAVADAAEPRSAGSPSGEVGAAVGDALLGLARTGAGPLEVELAGVGDASD